MVATTEEAIVVGINVGRDEKGGRVGVGRNELMDSFAGIVITSDCKPNSVETASGIYVMVRRVVCDCGRLTTEVTEPREELKIDQISAPLAERVRFTEASEEGRAVRKRVDAWNSKNICGIIFPDLEDGPVVDIVKEFDACQAPAHDCGSASTVDALQTNGV